VTHDVTPQEEVEQVPAEHGRGAAFFDLDRTLMAGSSGLYWARAARGAGLLTRRRIARYGWENVKFRLRGSTDQATDRVRREVGEMISGQRVVDLQRLAPKVLAGVLPRLYPQMLEVAHAHQDAGRPVYICTAASQEMAEMLAHVLSFDGALGARSEVVDGHYTGRPAGPFTDREGKASSRPPRASTWAPRTPTRTRSPTCRCCARSAIPSSSTRTPRCGASRARRAGRSCASSSSAGA
jgi:phosphoserine phosphatase